MPTRRPSLLHVVVTLLLACQSLVASAALPYGCAAQGLPAVAAVPAAADHGHIHCDDAAPQDAAAVPDGSSVKDAASDAGEGSRGGSGHGAASCHCLHSNGCAMLSTVTLPSGPRASALVPQAAADRVEPFLPTEHRPPISPAAA